MTCFYPLKVARLYDPDSHTYSISYSTKDLDHPDCVGYLRKACGQCIGCRIEKSRQWAMRCVKELGPNGEGAFLTLTYNNENLPADGSLQKKYFRGWMKRLRERIRYHYGKTIRYFCCGEYGEKLGRPHYHAVIFGFDFPDKQLRSVSRGNKLYTSKFLDKAWKKGFHLIGNVTFHSCQYVAQYVNKKVISRNSQKVKDYYQNKEIEFHTQSTRPGLGFDHWDEFYTDIYPSDRFVHMGKEMKPPKYYDYLLKKHHPELWKQVVEKRIESYENSDWATMNDADLEVELRRKERFLHRAHERTYHRLLDKELANA